MSNTNKRGTKRQAPTESSNQSVINENLTADDGVSVPGTATYDENLSQISGEKRRRKKFTPTERAHVAQVRKAGACAECRSRKVKCSHALLQGTDAFPNSIPAPKPSPQHYPFEFEAKAIGSDFSDPRYPERIEVANQLLPSDVAQFDDGSHLIATVPARETRQETLNELYDFANVFEDNAGHSPAKNLPHTPQWSPNSPWVQAAALYSQPSTAYPPSNANFSADLNVSSSTPASSHGDSRFPFTRDIAYCPCNEYGCDRQHKATQDVHSRSHQEFEHADVQSPTIFYRCPVSCGARPFKTANYLQHHIIHNHPEIQSGTTQLPSSHVSEHGAHPDGMAYFQDVNHNPIATVDQGTAVEFDHVTARGWRQAKSPVGAPSRVLRESSMRRSTSPRQTHPSAITVDDSGRKPSRRFSIASSNHGLRSPATNSNASFNGLALHGHDNIGWTEDFSMQRGIPQSNPRRTNSPTPSLINKFEENIHISDYQESEEPHRHGMFVTANTSLLAPPVFPQDTRSTMTFNVQAPNTYGNPQHTPIGNNIQSDYSGLGLSLPTWSEQTFPTTTNQIDDFNGGYGPLGLQPNALITRYIANDGSMPNFPVPSSADQPTLMLNDKPMQNPDFPFAIDELALEQFMSNTSSAPQLEYNTSTMSSSGASDSVLSMADAQAQNSSNGKCLDDWDAFIMNQNDEMMA